MVEILSPTGLEKPSGGELHSRAQYLRNLDRMNAGAVQIDFANSTFKDANWDMTLCKFTRIRVGTMGIIVADILVSLKAVGLPGTGSPALEVAGVIPPGYCPLPGASQALQAANTANSGTGLGLQVGLKNDRAFQIRANSAAGTTTLTAGSTLTWSTAYRWDGVL